MVSSPKDQKQGDSTEKQADPISIYNQLDHRHKQKSACQEHNAIHSASSRSIVSHVDVQHPSGRLDQGVLILALPLDLPAHLAIVVSVAPVDSSAKPLDEVERKVFRKHTQCILVVHIILFVLAFILFWDIAVILVVADAMLSAMLIFGIIKNKFSVR